MTIYQYILCDDRKSQLFHIMFYRLFRCDANNTLYSNILRHLESLHLMRGLH